MSDIILIIVIILIIFFIWKVLKPYFLKYDTTILFCGGLGSGKTLNCVKTAKTLYRKNITIWKWKKRLHDFKQLFKKKCNRVKFTQEMPLFYSTIPVKMGKYQSYQLLKEHLTLELRINQNSVVFIDELPNIVNQFNWNLEDVQFHLNEFITFFRHYIGGYLVVNGQAESEIVKQVRVKLNSYYWCFNFQKFLFFFYRVRILHSQISENDVSLSSDFIEENTRWTYGILPRKIYNTRAYKHRYDKLKKSKNIRFNSKDLTTNRIFKFGPDKSKLNDPDTEEKNIKK